MKRYTFNPRLGVMVESPAGEWVMHAEAKHCVALARRQARPVAEVLKYDPTRDLPVKFVALNPPPQCDGVDIDRAHRLAAAVEVA